MVNIWAEAHPGFSTAPGIGGPWGMLQARLGAKIIIKKKIWGFQQIGEVRSIYDESSAEVVKIHLAVNNPPPPPQTPTPNPHNYHSDDTMNEY